MKREFAKWILDIAKYIVTAMLLTTMFSDMSNDKVIIFSIIVAATLLVWGLWLHYKEDLKDKNKEKKGKRK